MNGGSILGLGGLITVLAAPAAPATFASTSERILLIVDGAASFHCRACMQEFVVALLRAAAASDCDKVEAYLLNKPDAEAGSDAAPAVGELLLTILLLGEKGERASIVGGAVAAEASLTSSGKSWVETLLLPQKRCRNALAVLLLATPANMLFALAILAPLAGVCRGEPPAIEGKVPSLESGTAGEFGTDA